MSGSKLRRRAFLAAALATFCALCPSAEQLSRAAESDASPADAPAIDADFPGGNLVLDRIEGDRVYLHQDQRDTPGFWFYWCFRVQRAAGRKLAFHFTKGNVLGVRGPAVSTDGGENWEWLGADSMDGASFVYAFPDDAAEVRFCMGIPYLEANLQEFLRRHQGDPCLKVEHHSTTKKGRNTERLRLGKLDGEPDHRVLLTARHHACEMMASWALEGLMDAVLADAPDGRWLREHVEFLVVPFMDKDGVEDGDQGKNRKPHDHNRDYLGEPIYPSVRALKEFAPQWSGGRLHLAIDMHCPYIRGGGDGTSSNERIFFVGNPSQETWEHQQQFSRILQQVQTGPLVHNPKHNLPWGEKWNTLKEPRMCSRWSALVPGVQIGTAIEIPYANVAGAPVTANSARALGHDLARTIRGYLEKRGGAD